MLKKSDISGIIKTGVILFLITGVAAMLLALVNNVTAPIIAKTEAEKQTMAIEKVMPEADSNREVAGEEYNKIVKTVYELKKAEDVCGYAVIVEPMGYNGKVSMVVGVDKEGKVTGIDITNQSETPGLGANCVNDEFKNQFVGKTAGIEVVKNQATDNSIDAITSATITSRAVTEGVNVAIETVLKIEEEMAK